jgi:hypothetical protein
MKRLTSSLLLLGLIFAHSCSSAETNVSQAVVLPLVLQTFLQEHPEYHLVTSSDFADENKKGSFAHQHEGDGFHSAVFRVMDTNHDGRDDVVAIVVKDGLFNALVLQATRNRTSHTLYWLVRDSQDTIAGVFIDTSRYIRLNNLTCCHTPWVFGWTGSEYELDVLLPGAYACIAPNVSIYPNVKSQAIPLLITKELVGATVQKIGIRQGDHRWYQIKLRNKSARSGYVLSKDIGEITNCALLKD